jgi:hypothetical protein
MQHYTPMIILFYFFENYQIPRRNQENLIVLKNNLMVANKLLVKTNFLKIRVLQHLTIIEAPNFLISDILRPQHIWWK